MKILYWFDYLNTEKLEKIFKAEKIEKKVRD